MKKAKRVGSFQNSHEVFSKYIPGFKASTQARFGDTANSGPSKKSGDSLGHELSRQFRETIARKKT